jgi:hypothetical protein
MYRAGSRQPMNDVTELGRALDALAASGKAEVREDGEWLADLAALQCEVRQVGSAPVVHLWSDRCNLTRRVVRVREQTEDHVILEVQRFGSAKPVRLEIFRTDSPRPAGRIAREQFRCQFRRILTGQFPDATIESLTSAPDLEHSFSGVYVRGRMHEGSHGWAVMAVSPEEDATAVEGMLAFGILWLDWTRGHSSLRAMEGLRLFAPEGKSRPLRERILALNSSAQTEIFEFTELEGRMRKMDLADAGNLQSRLAARKETEAALENTREAFAQIRALAEAMAAEKDAIQLRVVAGTREVELCFRGLEFARWTPDGIYFGLVDAQERLAPATEARLERLLRQLELHRNPFTNETTHRLFRAAPEKWLETIVQQDPARLDAQLNPDHLYSQIPALAGGDRGVMDLLGVTRRGRLVVIEIKASEDLQLPIQAVDYWLRVRRRQREGDFERLGYFNGVELDSKPPLIWLVAPGLRFHPATDTLLKYLSPEISISRIGVSEDWRRGIRVVLRQ